MTTATLSHPTTRVRSQKVIAIGTAMIRTTPTGLKIGSKGKVVAAGVLYGCFSKGEARRIRKALRAVGQNHKAGMPRQNQ